MTFSVIVPIYNVGRYLSQCIDSILIQSFADYELILVDDGSTDDSRAICDAYAKKDKRIRVIHKANGGLSDARNVGIDKALGDYIWFIDSDDYLLRTDAFQKVAEILEENDADVVFYSYKKFFEDSGQYSNGMYAHLPETAGMSDYIRINAYKALAWNKVVRSLLIRKHGMCFPIGRIGEDLVWCADLLSYAKKIVPCKDDLLAYRQHSGSITGNTEILFQSRHIEDAIFLMNEAIKKYLKEKNIEKENEMIGNYLGYEFSWLLGAVYPYWGKYAYEIRRLAFLLQYDMCDKVKKVCLLKNVMGLKMSSFLLYRFILYKNSSKLLRKNGVMR